MLIEPDACIDFLSMRAFFCKIKGCLVATAECQGMLRSAELLHTIIQQMDGAVSSS